MKIKVFFHGFVDHNRPIRLETGGPEYLPLSKQDAKFLLADLREMLKKLEFHLEETLEE